MFLSGYIQPDLASRSRLVMKSKDDWDEKILEY